MCNTLHGYPETFITSKARKIISVNLDCYRLNKRGLQPQRPQTIQGLKLFLVKGSNFHLTNYLEVQTRSELASVDSKVAAEQQNIVGSKKYTAHASLSVHYIMQHTTEL